MDTKEWLPYFPEVADAGELSQLIESISGRQGVRPPPHPVGGDEAAARQVRVLVERHNAKRWPFVGFAVDLTPVPLLRLVELLRRHRAFAGDEENLVYAALAPLLGALQDHLIRTLVTELHAYRARSALTGDTSEDRFASFVDQIAAPEYQAGFRERYPVLLADLERIGVQRLDHVREILDAVEADRGVLEDVCARPAGDRVVSLPTGSGDRHRRGRTVAVVTFASGARAVYKPRSLLVDRRFAVLIDRLNEGLDLGLRTPRAVDRGSHGWMEFVEFAPPADRAEAEDYYRRVGHLTAVLYALNTNDIHHENIIGYRGTPVLIDLETMLHPVLTDDTVVPRSAEARVYERLSRSVSVIGILPTVIGAGEHLADIGGVGFEDRQRSPYKSFSFVDYGRDDMRIALTRTSLESAAQVPRISAVGVAPAAISGLVQDGFTTVIDWVIAHRSEFIELVTGLFTGTEVRYVHKPTFLYGQLLRMATHPSLLGDAERRYVLLHRVALSRRSSPIAVVAAELRDLDGGDVPYFTARADETVLYDSFGRSLGDLLDDSPLGRALAKIESLDRADRDAQLALIAMSFVNKFPPETDRTGFTLPERGAVTGAADDRREWLAEAVSIGDGLVRDLVPTEAPGTSPNWLTAQVSNSQEQLWQPGPLSFDLYGGVTGVAYFLALLGTVSGNERFGEAALSVLEPLAALFTEGRLSGDTYSSGAFQGMAGVVYVLDRAGRALGRPDLVAAAADGLDRLRDHIAQDTMLDVIGGAAGVLAVALTVHGTAAGTADRERALAVAEDAARHLMANYPALGEEPPAGTVYSGFAHGVTGLLPYLARLARITGDSAPRAAVTRLLAALDDLRDPSGTDWFTSSLRDMRSYGWCHGAPGILLGLCLLQQEDGGYDLGERIAAARDRTLERGFGNNVTLCHGDLGNLEILRLCARVTDDAALAARCRAADSALLRTYVDRYRSRTDCKHLYTNSLLIGTSGIGLAFLRSLDAERVPPPLWLG